jgi:hypothetical protein
MNVSAAAESNLLATPWRRCVDETNSRGMPSGVGRGVGWQKMPELVSTETSFAVGLGDGASEDEGSGSQAELHSAGVAMTMAVEICCAITHPTIFSRKLVVSDGVRNKYALDTGRVEGVSGGADRARLMVLRRMDNCTIIRTCCDRREMDR